MLKHTEDIIMKNIMELFKDDAIKFFGIDKKVVTAVRTELTELKLQKNIDDWVLLTEDDTYIHFEFQTTYDKNDLTRFMVSDAMLYNKDRKPIKTIVVYSNEITNTETSLNIGSIQYSVDAFYMVDLDGESIYNNIKLKVENGNNISKQDLMNIVFLPLMKNKLNKVQRIEQSINLSKKIANLNHQLQVQAMLNLLAEKFIKDEDELSRIRRLMNMTKIAEMIANDAKQVEKLEIAKNLLKEGATKELVLKVTGLTNDVINNLLKEISKETH